MGPSVQQAFCDSLGVVGPDVMAQSVMNGATSAGGALDPQATMDWVRAKVQSGC
jgi:hypothetical protein